VSIGIMAARFERLLVPIDGSRRDERALEIVHSLIHKEPVHVTLVHVIEVRQSMPLDAELPAEIEKGEAILQRAELMALKRPGSRPDLVLAELLQARSPARLSSTKQSNEMLMPLSWQSIIEIVLEKSRSVRQPRMC